LNKFVTERHLQKLPKKSYAVAPGTPVGGMVFVMDKPCGIEEGMVGISMDSIPYRKFIANNINYFNSEIKQRLDATKTVPYPIGEQLIDWILKDSQMSQNGYFSPSYKENGLSGMFFEEYKKSLSINNEEKFYKQIAKLTNAGNEVYMVKQDGPMVLGGSGPTITRIQMTTTFQKNKKKYGRLIANAIALGQRAYYIMQNRPKEVNQDAIIEALSTKLASAYGMLAQHIDIIEGTYENGSPKICTIVTWNNGCNDLSGHLLGGEQYYTGNVCISSDTTQDIRYELDGSLVYKIEHDNELQYYKLQTNGNTVSSSPEEYENAIFVPIKVANDNKTIIKVTIEQGNISFSKILPDGTKQPATAEEYHKANAVSDHNIHGLGESLITILSLGDRDGIGKKGQNKAIMPILGGDGKPTGEYDFFGIDFGKAYNGANKLLPTLRDNFYVDTFDNADANTCFSNYAMLYDNPLTEKMKGVYLLAAQQGKLTSDQIKSISEEYQKEDSNDPFSNKLINAAKQENQSPHLTIINNEIARVKKLTITGSKKEKKQYQSVLMKLKDIRKIIKDNDQKILSVFDKRMKLSPTQIRLLDNIEKLTAKNAATLSHGVRLNHIRVNNVDRVPWQLELNKDGTFDLYCENTENLTQASKKRLEDFLIDSQLVSHYDAQQIKISSLKAKQVTALAENLSEEKVASIRDLSLRTHEHRIAFNLKMGIGKPMTLPENKQNSEPTDNFETIKNTSLLLSPKHSPEGMPKDKQKRVTTKLSESTSFIPEKKRHTALEEHKITIKDLRTKLNQADVKQSLGIVHIYDRQLTHSNTKPRLEIEFEIKSNKNKAQVFKGYAKDISLDQKGDTPEIEYSIDDNMETTLERQAIQHMCELAVATAKPNTEFNLTDIPEDKRKIVQRGLQSAIKKYIAQNKFKEGEEPKITQNESSTHRINPMSGG